MENREVMTMEQFATATEEERRGECDRTIKDLKAMFDEGIKNAPEFATEMPEMYEFLAWAVEQDGSILEEIINTKIVEFVISHGEEWYYNVMEQIGYFMMALKHKNNTEKEGIEGA